MVSTSYKTHSCVNIITQVQQMYVGVCIVCWDCLNMATLFSFHDTFFFSYSALICMLSHCCIVKYQVLSSMSITNPAPPPTPGDPFHMFWGHLWKWKQAFISKGHFSMWTPWHYIIVNTGINCDRGFGIGEWCYQSLPMPPQIHALCMIHTSIQPPPQPQTEWGYLTHATSSL